MSDDSMFADRRLDDVKESRSINMIDVILHR